MKVGKLRFVPTKKNIKIIRRDCFANLALTNYGRTIENLVAERRIGANAQPRIFVERRNRRWRNPENYLGCSEKII